MSFADVVVVVVVVVVLIDVEEPPWFVDLVGCELTVSSWSLL